VLSFETCKFLFDFFVLLSTFRNSGFTEVTVSRQKKKQVSLFCSRLSVTLQHDLPT